MSQELIAKIITDLCLALIPVLAALLGKVLLNVIQGQKNAQIRALAVVAVHWAEDQISSGSKLQAAASKLSEMSKGKISVADATTLVAATYAQLTGALDPLVQNPSAPSTTGSTK